MKHTLIYEIGSDKVNKENCIKAKLHDLYYSFNIASMSKSLTMKWVGHKAYTVKKTNKRQCFSHCSHKTSNKKITRRILGGNRTEVNRQGLDSADLE